jgi:hypothetical protein
MLDYRTPLGILFADSGAPTLDLSLMGSLDSRVSFTRASTATDLLSSTAATDGAYTSYAINAPRLLTNGLLGEEQRSQFLGVTDTPATQTTGSLSTGSYTLWVIGTGSAAVTAGSATITGAGSATQGTPLTFTVTVAGTVTVTKTGTLARFQLENGAFATSYIPNAGAAGTSVTRNSDMATIATSAFNYNQNAGTFLVEYQVSAAAVGNAYALSFVNASNTDKIFSYRGSAASDIRAISVPGASDVKESGTEYGVSSFAKVAGTYAPVDFAGAINGTLLTPASTGTAATDITKLVIGNAGAGTGAINGVIRRIRYWPRRLPSSQLQALTS